MKSLDEVKSELQCLAEGGCKGVCGECDFNGPVCLLTTISDTLDQIRCLERVRAEQASTITSLRDAINKQQKGRMRLLDEILRLESQIPQWISVEERLPEALRHYGECSFSDDVLVYDGVRDRVAYYCNTTASWHDSRYEDDVIDVIRWMPLPIKQQET